MEGVRLLHLKKRGRTASCEWQIGCGCGYGGLPSYPDQSSRCLLLWSLRIEFFIHTDPLPTATLGKGLGTVCILGGSQKNEKEMSRRCG